VQELGQIAALDPSVFDQAKNQAKKSEITLRPGRVGEILSYERYYQKILRHLRKLLWNGKYVKLG
jgi:hypothetical protein